MRQGTTITIGQVSYELDAKGCFKGTKITPGQLVYEVEASQDRSNRYWPEWRDLPDHQKARREEYALQVLALLQGKQDDQEEEVV
jgi:hypothetical protein